jgi:hypothetical protein
MAIPWNSRVSSAWGDEKLELANASAMMDWLLFCKGKGKGRYMSAGKGPAAGGKGQAKGNAVQTACRCCGGKGHSKKDCMHWSKTCHNCGRKGHLAHVCNQEVQRLPKDPAARTPGAAPASYASVVKTGKSRVCGNCDNFMPAETRCCQRPECIGKGKAAGKGTGKAPRAADKPAPLPKGGQESAPDGDQTELLRRITKYEQMLAECIQDGMSATSLEEGLTMLRKAVAKPPTQYSDAMAAKEKHNNKCNGLRQLELYRNRIKEAEADALVRNAGFTSKRQHAIAAQEEAHKATLLAINEDYEQAEAEFKKKHTNLMANFKEKLDRQQADLEKIEAEGAALDADELPDEVPARMEEVPPLANWPANLDEKGKAELEACLQAQIERIRMEKDLENKEEDQEMELPEDPKRKLDKDDGNAQQQEKKSKK